MSRKDLIDMLNRNNEYARLIIERIYKVVEKELENSIDVYNSLRKIDKYDATIALGRMTAFKDIENEFELIFGYREENDE